MVLIQQLHHVEHRADFVRQENGKLPDERAVKLGGGLC
jgi:hypothetical protein